MSKWKSDPPKRPAQPKVGKEKPVWMDPNTKTSFSAGGILIYDEEGFYLVGEEAQKGINYGDLGGRFMPEDGSIWTTIRRELYEESYGIVDVYVDEIEELSKSKSSILVAVEPVGSSLCGKLLQDVVPNPRSHSYLCLVINKNQSPRIQKLIQACTNVQDYERRRRKFVDEVFSPQKIYLPLHIKKVPYSDLSSIPKSYRFASILTALLKTEQFKIPSEL